MQCGTTLAALGWRRFLAAAPQAVGSRNGQSGRDAHSPFRPAEDLADALAGAVDRAWLAVELVLAGPRLRDRLPASSLATDEAALGAVRGLLDAVPLGPVDPADAGRAWRALLEARQAFSLGADPDDLAELVHRAAQVAESFGPEAVAAGEAGELDRLAEEWEAAGREALCPLLHLRWHGRDPLLVVLTAALIEHDLAPEAAGDPPTPFPAPAGPAVTAPESLQILAEALVRHGNELSRLLESIRPEDPGRPRGPAEDVDLAARLQAGLALLRRGDYDRAAAAFTEVLSADPDCLEAHVHRAEAWRNRGDYARAVASLDDAHRLAPGDAGVLFNRGRLHGLLGRTDAAVADYTAALRLDPAHALAHAFRGAAYLETGTLDEALDDLNEALRLDPSCPLAHQSRAEVMVLHGRLDAAIADYTQLLRRTPFSADAYLRRGDVYLLKLEFERAIADFSHALRLDPLHVTAHVRRASAYRRHGQDDLALADLNGALRLDPDNEGIYHQRGLALRALKNYPAALADFDRALRIRRDPEHHFERGRTHELREDLDRALDDFNAAIDLDPTSAAYRRTRGALFVRRGQIDAAIDDFTASLERNGRLAEVYVDRAEAWIAKGRLDLAIADCDTALACDPGLAAAYLTRGGAHAQQGDYVRADADFTAALAISPRDPHIFQVRAEGALARGEYEQALRDLGRALQLSPGSAVGLYLRGTANQALDRQEAALADFNQAMLLDRRYTAAYCNQRASVHAARGDYEQALADYAIVLQLDPANVTALAGREEAQAALLAAGLKAAARKAGVRKRESPAAAPARGGPRPAARPRQQRPSDLKILSPRPAEDGAAAADATQADATQADATQQTRVHSLGVLTQVHVPLASGPPAELAPDVEGAVAPPPVDSSEVLETPPAIDESQPDRAVAPPDPPRPGPSRGRPPVEEESDPQPVGPVDVQAEKAQREMEVEDRARQWAEMKYRERVARGGGTATAPRPRDRVGSSGEGLPWGVIFKVVAALLLIGLLGGAGYYFLFQNSEPRLDAARVWEEYDANTEGMNEKYKGRFVQVTGRINLYPVGTQSRFFFEFPEGAKWGIEFTLPGPEMKKLQAGQTITVRGKLAKRKAGSQNNLLMSNCTLLKIDP